VGRAEPDAAVGRLRGEVAGVDGNPSLMASRGVC